jgi:uncharacterized protein (TIGR03905 family)
LEQQVKAAIDNSIFEGYTISDNYCERRDCMKLSLSHDGSCAKGIEIEIVDGRIVSTEFIGGVPGNPRVIAALSEGMEVAEAVKCLKNMDCNGNLSCPGRLALALEEAVGK